MDRLHLKRSDHVSGLAKSQSIVTLRPVHNVEFRDTETRHKYFNSVQSRLNRMVGNVISKHRLETAETAVLQTICSSRQDSFSFRFSSALVCGWSWSSFFAKCCFSFPQPVLLLRLVPYANEIAHPCCRTKIGMGEGNIWSPVSSTSVNKDSCYPASCFFWKKIVPNQIKPTQSFHGFCAGRSLRVRFQKRMMMMMMRPALYAPHATFLGSTL